MAACSAIFSGIPKGRILLPSEVYFGVRSVLETTFAPWGLVVEPVPSADTDALERALQQRPATENPDGPTIVWIEVRRMQARGERSRTA